jgi:hypothetical protein
MVNFVFSCFAPGKIALIALVFHGKKASWMGRGVSDVGAAKEIPHCRDQTPILQLVLLRIEDYSS